MSINPYQNIDTASDYQVYEFDSMGKVTLRKRAKFELIDEQDQLYNLALCTILPDGSEDCSSASKNGDMNTVLETAAQIALIYSDKFPERKIFLRGSDGLRSRKYQIGINAHLVSLSANFEVEGVMINDQNEIILLEKIQKGKNYQGFIFTRKLA
ncbi:MAG: hypothetical protein V4594_08360 [Bacteroidota bacterium]